jgi:hypothetical protein
MRTTLLLAGMIFAGGCATGSEHRAEPSAPAEPQMSDADRIRESLKTMDERDRAVMMERLDLVEELGLSDYDNEASPQPGDPAPDFALMPLRIYDFQLEGGPVTESNAGELYEPVQLSAFRGKLPVVLIFGSYT